jgi:hypothetical protein
VLVLKVFSALLFSSLLFFASLLLTMPATLTFQLHCGDGKELNYTFNKEEGMKILEMAEKMRLGEYDEDEDLAGVDPMLVKHMDFFANMFNVETPELRVKHKEGGGVPWTPEKVQAFNRDHGDRFCMEVGKTESVIAPVRPPAPDDTDDEAGQVQKKSKNKRKRRKANMDNSSNTA